MSSEASVSLSAARASVLSNAFLFHRILSNDFSAADLANVERVSPAWRRHSLVHSDALWLPLWSAECPSLQLQGRAPRDALRAVRRATAAPPQQPEWQLADYTLSLDVTWARPEASRQRLFSSSWNATQHVVAGQTLCILSPTVRWGLEVQRCKNSIRGTGRKASLTCTASAAPLKAWPGGRCQLDCWCSAETAP